MRTPSLDQLDYSILRRLQRDARTIAESIAAEVGMSTAPVQRRIKRLRETGVIKREVFGTRSQDARPVDDVIVVMRRSRWV